MRWVREHWSLQRDGGHEPVEAELQREVTVLVDAALVRSRRAGGARAPMWLGALAAAGAAVAGLALAVLPGSPDARGPEGPKPPEAVVARGAPIAAPVARPVARPEEDLGGVLDVLDAEELLETRPVFASLSTEYQALAWLVVPTASLGEAPPSRGAGE